MEIIAFLRETHLSYTEIKPNVVYTTGSIALSISSCHHLVVKLTTCEFDILLYDMAYMASSRVFPEWLAPGSLPDGLNTEIKQSPDGLARLAHTEASDGSWGLTAYEVQIGSGGKFTPTLAVETSVVPGTEGHINASVLVTDSFRTYFHQHPELVASQVALLPDGRSIPINTFILGSWSSASEQVMQAKGVMPEAPKAYQVDFEATVQALNDQFAAGDFSRPPQIILKSP